MIASGRLLDAFADLRLTQVGPGRWRASCPLHQLHTRNLNVSIWRGDRRPLWCLACWAGCDKKAILQAVGLTMHDLFDDGTKPPAADQPRRKVVATYDYRDEAGTLLYQVVRYDPKGFSQRRPAAGPEAAHSRDGWRWMLSDVRRVLYRTPDLLAKPQQPVLVVEGEKKADRLSALGLVATCNVGGCGMGWLPEYSRQLQFRRVVVLPDNDAPGLRHAWNVAGSLLCHHAASIRVVQLPELPPGGDVCDWLDRANTVADLVAVIKASAEWRAAS